ncbi:MAG: hypothetical protein AAF705_11520, partial [Bacteroidota bacterium]
MTKIQIKYLVVIFLSLMISSCEDDDEPINLSPQGNVFFNVEQIEVNRTSSQAVVIDLKYLGSPTSQ